MPLSDFNGPSDYMNLHLIQRSPYQYSALADCLKLCAEQDAILFMEDGVLGQSHTLLNDVANPKFALQDDLNARGLSIADNVTPCSYTEFVELCTRYKKVISWF